MAVGTKHRIRNTSDEHLVSVEVQNGTSTDRTTSSASMMASAESAETLSHTP